MSASLLAWACATPEFVQPAMAQAVPVAGETLLSLPMVEDRTVIFEPTADGQLKIIKVENDNPHAAVPRNPGQVAVTMNYALEIGTVIEFNSGLDYDASYRAVAIIPSTRDSGEFTLRNIDSCPIAGNAVSSDQWPQPYPVISITRVERLQGAAVCKAG
jgi:hypothetical protein